MGLIEYREATGGELCYAHKTWSRSLYHERADYQHITERGFADLWAAPLRSAIGRSRVLVAVIEDLCVGVIIFDGPRLWYVYVSKEYRRRGIGAELLRLALGDVTPLCACVTPSWEKWSRKPALWRWKPQLWRNL